MGTVRLYAIAVVVCTPLSRWLTDKLEEKDKHANARIYASRAYETQWRDLLFRISGKYPRCLKSLPEGPEQTEGAFTLWS
jgi:hypothetical protein